MPLLHRSCQLGSRMCVWSLHVAHFRSFYTCNAQQESRLEKHYGLVFALQVSVPEATVNLVHSHGNEFAEVAGGLFRVCITEIQTTFAVEDGELDTR